MSQACAGSFHCVVVKEGGTVVGWGANGSGRAVPPQGLCRGRKARCVAAGELHSLAILDDGSVVAWGKNDTRTKVPKLERRAVSISAGTGQSMALLSNGTVVGWGHNHHGEARPPKLHRKSIQVSCGRTHSLILLDNGNVITVGTFPPPDIPPSRKVVRVAAGGAHSLAILDDNTVIGWGNNSAGETDPPPLPEGRRFADISAGGKHSVALLDDGSVLCWGHPGSARTTPPPFKHPIVAVSAGGLHSMAVDEVGEVYVWGYSGNGQGSLPSGPSLRAYIRKKKKPKGESTPRQVEKALPPLRGNTPTPFAQAVEMGVMCCAAYEEVDVPPKNSVHAIELSDLPQPPQRLRPASAKRHFSESVAQKSAKFPNQTTENICDVSRLALPRKHPTHPVFHPGSLYRPVPAGELTETSLLFKKCAAPSVPLERRVL